MQSLSVKIIVQSLTVEKSRARMIIALAYALLMGFLAALAALIINPTGQLPEIALVLGGLGVILFFPFVIFAVFFSFTDHGFYELNKYYCISHKAFGGKDEIINYEDAVKIRINIPRWSNFFKVFYADITVMDIRGKQFRIEPVSDWETALIYLVENVSKTRDTPYQDLLFDSRSQYIYLLAITNCIEQENEKRSGTDG